MHGGSLVLQLAGPPLPSGTVAYPPPRGPHERRRLALPPEPQLEKDLRKDLLFEPDLGIPIHPWNIERCASGVGGERASRVLMGALAMV